MATLIDYRGLQVVSPDPTGNGGLAIQNNLKQIVDWNPKGVWGQSASPTVSDDNTQEYYPGSLWLRTDTTPSQLFVCKSSATATASWLPILLNATQDTSPKLGGDLDVNGHQIKDASAVTIAVSGNSVATVTPSTVQIQGNTLIGTTTTPTGATFNITVGGGSTSPVLGAATSDMVSLAGVDKAAGDRRLYIQSEAGSPISIGNDRLNFAASSGYLSVGGNNVLQIQSGILTFLNLTAPNDTNSTLFKLNVGADGTLGPVIMGIGFRPSATGSNRTAYIGVYDTGAMRTLALNCNGSNSFGNVTIGTTTVGTGATQNLALGGPATTPVIGAATADQVNLAAVDKAAGDRRLYVQSELGSAISLGNDRLNFAASAGLISIGGADIVSMTVFQASFSVPGSFSKTFVDGGNGISNLAIASTANSITANTSNILYGINNDTRLNQAGFNATNALAVVANYSSATGAGTSGTITGVQAFSGRAGNSSTGTVTNATCFYAQQPQNFAGGTVTNWHGFNVEPGTAATNIYGFRGQIASTGGRYNLYMDGTADNYLAGKLGIGNITPAAQLHLKPSGPGYAIYIDRLATGTGNAQFWAYGLSNSANSNNSLWGEASSTYTTGSPTFGWIGNSETFVYYPTTLKIGTGVGALPTLTFSSQNVALGTATFGSGATFNFALGGGSTTPVLGGAVADAVSLAAVDKSAGDRRLYIQSELGSQVSLGNDRLNFAASLGSLSVAGTDSLSVTSTGVTIPGTLAVNGSVVLGDAVGDTVTQNALITNVPNGIYFQKIAETGIAETIARFAVSDDTSVLAISNATNSAGVFAPTVTGTQSGASTAVNLIGVGTTDTGGEALVRFTAYKVGGTAITTRPLFMFVSVNTGILSVTAGYNLQFLGGATTPVLNVAATDTVSVAAVDKAAGDRRFYLQSELGSPISLGNDRLNFAASNGILSIGGADIIGLSSSGATLSDAMNIAIGSTVGTKIGTSTSQKISFWNASPVAQFATTGTSAGFSAGTGTAVNSVSTFTGNLGSSAYTIGDIVAALKKCGLMAS